MKLPTDQQLIEKYRSGQLMYDIFDLFDYQDRSDLNAIISTCVKLHNSGKIDLLSLINEPDLNQIEASVFFSGQHFFCKAIPKMNAPTRDVMQCIHDLVKKGGEDLAAYQPNAALREWCEADLSRAHEIVDAAKNNDPLAVEFLTFALTAGNMYENSREFIETALDERRLSSIVALGRMKHKNLILAREALTTLQKSLSNDADDRLHANVLMASLNIVENIEQINCGDVIDIIKQVCETPGSETQYTCARVLLQYNNLLNENTVIHLLQTLKTVAPSNKGTIWELDNGLKELLKNSFSDHAIEFVTTFLSSSENSFSLSDFKGFSRALLNGSEKVFHKVLVTWLLSGERTLCDGLSQSMRNIEHAEKPIVIPIQDFELSDDEKIFISRKAIGFFFLEPVIACSILVSVLRDCEGETADVISNFLFDPLLLNYGGAATDYLKTIDIDDQAHTPVQAALEQHKKYLDQLKSAGEIKELHPTERERQLEFLRFSDGMQKALKGGMKESIFYNLAKHSTILYGNKTITYIETGDGERRPVEMKLHKHGSTVEYPRIDVIDPVGLDYMLRIFRSERLIS